MVVNNNTQFAIDIVEKIIDTLKKYISKSDNVERAGQIDRYSLYGAREIEKFKSKGIKVFTGNVQESKDVGEFTIDDVLKYYEMIDMDIEGSQDMVEMFDITPYYFKVPSPRASDVAEALREPLPEDQPEFVRDALAVIDERNRPSPGSPAPSPASIPTPQGETQERPPPQPALELEEPEPAPAAAAQTEEFITDPNEKKEKWEELTGLVQRARQLTLSTPDLNEAYEKIKDLMIQLDPIPPPSGRSRRNVRYKEYEENKKKYISAVEKAKEIQRLIREIDGKIAKLAYKELGAGEEGPQNELEGKEIVEGKIKSKMDKLKIQEPSGSDDDNHIDYLIQKNKILDEMDQESPSSGGGKKKRTHNKKKRRSKKKSTPIKKKK